MKKNEDFFKAWSPQMAYVLGFFAADGSMYVNKRGSHYMAFHSNDIEILEKIKTLLASDNAIGKKQITDRCPNQAYRLQIGSKKMYNDLLKLGMTENKSKILQFPYIPERFLSNFIRGYFDGDGNVLFKKYFNKRRNRHYYHFGTKFTSGSVAFLKELKMVLELHAHLKGGSLFEKNRGFCLSYSTKDSGGLFNFMYSGVKKELFLARKYNIFTFAINNLER